MTDTHISMMAYIPARNCLPSYALLNRTNLFTLMMMTKLYMNFFLFSLASDGNFVAGFVDDLLDGKPLFLL